MAAIVAPRFPSPSLLLKPIAVTVTGVLLAGVLSSVPAQAQIHPPKPGVEMPQAYFDRVAQDRTAFQFRRAWFGEAERVQQARHLLEIGVLDGASSGVLQTAVSGTKLVPVLAGKFSNTASDPFTPADLQDRLFDGPVPTGTVTEYYTEISYGLINLSGTVFPTAGGLYQVSLPDTYYEGTSNGLGGDANTGEYLKELLDGLDGTIDFSQYDNDGPDGLPNSGDDDGYVDFAAFVHPERGGECGGSNLWSHRWVYEGWWGAPYTTNDAAAGGGFIRVSDYTIQPIVSCDDVSLIEIGVYAHEFGHAFGLPDLYDTNSDNGTSAGIGTFGLMGSGSWGGDNSHPERPSHMCAWSKEQLGWVTPTVLCGDPGGLSSAASLADVETTGEVLKIYPHGVLNAEYFLIENRVRTGFDQYLYTDGLAIWHIDNDQSGNGDETHKLVDLEEADGLAEMDQSLNRGNAGDLYPGSTGNTLFTDGSNPNSKDYLSQTTGLAVTSIDGTVNPRGFDIALSPCLLAVEDIAVHDATWGNNNGALDDFERANIQICLGNDFDEDKTNVTGVLSVLSAGVTLLSDSTDYGLVTAGPANCGSVEFEVLLTSAFPAGTALDFRLDLTGDGGFTQSIDFSLYTGNYVLLVEDDGAANALLLYTNAISGAGYTYVHHDIDAQGTPGLGQMEAALAVVWYCGDSFDNTFTPAEQAVVSAYLDGGGALFASGQDVGYDLSAQGNSADLAFYQNYMHADYIADTANDATLFGVPGDPIGDGVSITLSGTLGNDLWPSDISARAGATDVFRYSPSKTGAVRYDTGHRTVYLAFTYERIDNVGTRATVMQRILDWLIPGDITPPTADLTAPNGGVFDACTSLSITWTAADDTGVTEVDLEYSVDSGAWQPIALGLANSGSYDWDVTGLSGVEFLVKLTARDAVALQAVDVSDAPFMLQDTGDPVATVIVPNGGELYDVEALVTISWSAEDSCSGIDSTEVWVSLNGGGAWTHEATVAAPDTSYDWTAPSTPSDSVMVRVLARDGAGNTATDDSDGMFTLQATSLGTPVGFAGVTTPVLLQNVPNPFAAGTRFSFYLPEESTVSLRVFDLSGRVVRTMAAGTFAPGVHEALWNGARDDGRPAASGMYFYVLETPGQRQVRKLIRTQ